MNTYLNSINADYIETLLKQYQTNPNQLDPSWTYFFDGMEIGSSPAGAETGKNSSPPTKEALQFELQVLEMVRSYRDLGYLIADLNPLERGCRTHPLLELSRFGLSEQDLQRSCDVGKLLGLGSVTLKEILQSLKRSYCSPATVEHAHIEDPKSRLWVQSRMESDYLAKPLSNDIRTRCLQKLLEAELIETFLHKRFVGQKRFSLEGNDTIIPMLDYLIRLATHQGAREVLIGMAHRGRLNVLANIFEKELHQMMGEFSGNFDANVGDGDVKYHMGFSRDALTVDGKKVHLSLMPNPSHLEAVNTVLMGVARTKQTLLKDEERMKVIPVLLHGDASFAGQGCVYEMLNMSNLPGYTVGGIVHIIVNNQIGFTTSPKEGRSTPQATDIAKMLEVPIFHVNADEPDYALRCIELALDFRREFKKDVVIDLVGYRRYGHNEGDEPTFTQPLLYKQIQKHPRVRENYSQKLLKEKIVSEKLHQEMGSLFEEKLEEGFQMAGRLKISPAMSSFGSRWTEFHKPTEEELFSPFQTGFSLASLKEIGTQLTTAPEQFHLHPKIRKILEERREMVEGKRAVDWGFAELLAFGSIAMEGYRIRLAGQDCERGTFSSRHAILNDIETGAKHNPFDFLHSTDGKKSEKVEIVNSLLSEYGALGFEFGQSLATPKQLTLWEAQFGDFVNSAQIIIDQFITCSAFKWQRYSGLVLLLPHGHEGQGPEHSSARLERFLTSCAQNNIQVCNVTTPSQYFHLLRRQILRKIRLPLVLMSPKSLLRHPKVISPLSEFEKGSFKELIDDQQDLKKTAKRVIFCSGKIYYDLLEEREIQKKNEIAIVRVEQFYPFPANEWNGLLKAYEKSEEIVWCQEAPQNMEGWSFIVQHLYPLMKKSQKLIYVGRKAQASPADSYLQLHQKEQKRIVTTALGDL